MAVVTRIMRNSAGFELTHSSLLSRRVTEGPVRKPSKFVRVESQRTYPALEQWEVVNGDQDMKIYFITTAGTMPNPATFIGWQVSNSYNVEDKTHTIDGQEVWICSLYGSSGSATGDTVEILNWGWDDGGQSILFTMDDKMIFTNNMSTILEYLD